MSFRDGFSSTLGALFALRLFGLIQPVKPPQSPPTHGRFIRAGSTHKSGQSDDLAVALRTATQTQSAMPLAIVGSVLLILGALFCAGIGGIAFALDQSSIARGFAIAALLCLLGAFNWLFFARRRDRRRTLRLTFDLSEQALARWKALAVTVESLAATSTKVLRAGAEAYEPQAHSNADWVFDAPRMCIWPRKSLRFVETSLDIPAIEPIPGVLYHFFPDRIIAISWDRTAAIPYSDLRFQFGQREVREKVERGLISIVNYNEVRIMTDGGMDHLIWIADSRIANGFVRALQRMAEQTLATAPLVPSRLSLD